MRITHREWSYFFFHVQFRRIFRPAFFSQSAFKFDPFERRGLTVARKARDETSLLLIGLPSCAALHTIDPTLNEIVTNFATLRIEPHVSVA
jgi:hypothetical protein